MEQHLEGIDVDAPMNVPNSQDMRQGSSGLETPDPHLSNIMGNVQSHPTLNQDGSREKLSEAIHG